MLAFLATLESLAGKAAEVSRDPECGRLQWCWEGNTNFPSQIIPMIFVDFDADELSYHWCACEIDDGDAPLHERHSVCLGRIPLSFARVLRTFARSL
jgi:hypothetical protein